MGLDLTNGKRPSQALQRGMGRGVPTLNDEQCVVFDDLVNEHGGWPFGVSEARTAFGERYEVVGEGERARWVKR